MLAFFFFQAEDGIRDFCLSRGLGDVYKRQAFPALVSPSAFPALVSPSAFPALVSPSAFPALVSLSLIHI
ncbi:hypothetical protein CDFC105_93929 [Clostridioides difficile]|nr:hypothetical protein CDFC105_93929 [Clostridioides difficile]